MQSNLLPGIEKGERKEKKYPRAVFPNPCKHQSNLTQSCEGEKDKNNDEERIKGRERINHVVVHFMNRCTENRGKRV